MYESITIQLPSNDYDAERLLKFGYTDHGDITLQLRYGSTEPYSTKNFKLAHGNDETIVACLAGFCCRLGMTESKRSEIFTEAGSRVLSENLELGAARTQPINANHLRTIASGKEFPRFNNFIRGWEALCVPIPNRPGDLSKVGGTGFYTRTDIFGIQSLLLQKIPPNWASMIQVEEEYTQTIAEIYEQDIPMIVKTVCDTSMGECRKSISWLLREITRYKS